MQLFLTVLLWTLAALLVLLVLLVVCPVWVHLELDYDVLTVKLQVFGLKFKVWPLAEKKPKAPKKKKGKKAKKASSATKKDEKPKEKKGLPFDLSFELIVQLIGLAGGLVRRLLKALKVRDVRLFLPVQGKDPAATAIRYGQIMAAANAAHGALYDAVRLSVDKIEICPDFGGDNKFRRSFYCKIGTCPIIIISVAVWALYALFKTGIFSRRQGGK